MKYIFDTATPRSKLMTKQLKPSNNNVKAEEHTLALEKVEKPHPMLFSSLSTKAPHKDLRYIKSCEFKKKKKKY